MAKLTAKHFKKFVGFCEKWKKKLGLMDWRITYDFKSPSDIEALEGNQAVVYMQLAGMIATVILNRDWHDATMSDIEQCAYHEMLEILLDPLVKLTGERYNVNESAIECEKHRIIRTFENLTFGG